MNKILLALLVSAMPLLSSANTLVFNNTTAITFSNFDVSIGTSTVNSGSFGKFTTTGSGNGILTASYIGKEAGYVNFYFDPYSTMGAMTGASVSQIIDGAGTVSFGFKTNNGSGDAGVFNNGDAQTAVLGYAVLNTTGYTGYDFVLGFNDFYPSDADYDDLVVGFKYTELVPVPASLPLMVSALGLFGFGVSRKRAQK